MTVNVLFPTSRRRGCCRRGRGVAVDPAPELRHDPLQVEALRDLRGQVAVRREERVLGRSGARRRCAFPPARGRSRSRPGACPGGTGSPSARRSSGRASGDRGLASARRRGAVAGLLLSVLPGSGRRHSAPHGECRGLPTRARWPRRSTSDREGWGCIRAATPPDRLPVVMSIASAIRSVTWGRSCGRPDRAVPPARSPP